KASRSGNAPQRGGRALPRHAPRAPRPEEVVAADRPERVEDLAAEEQAGVEPTLEGARVDLFEGHAPAGDLGLLVPLVPCPGKWIPGQGLEQATSLVATQLAEGPIGGHARFGEERIREAVRQATPYEGADRAAAALDLTFPSFRVQLRPLDVDRLRRAPLEAGPDGQVRDVQDRRTAVPAVREQETAVRRGAAALQGRLERDRERDARERRVARRICGERRQRGVGRANRMAERSRDAEARTVAPRLRHGQSTRGEDYGRGLYHLAGLDSDPPGSAVPRRLEPDDLRLEPDPRAPAAGQRQETVADVPRPVRYGEQLPRIRLELQLDPDFLLAEPALVRERPGAQQPLQHVGRGVGEIL